MYCSGVCTFSNLGWRFVRHYRDGWLRRGRRRTSAIRWFWHVGARFGVWSLQVICLLRLRNETIDTLASSLLTIRSTFCMVAGLRQTCLVVEVPEDSYEIVVRIAKLKEVMLHCVASLGKGTLLDNTGYAPDHCNSSVAIASGSHHG